MRAHMLLEYLGAALILISAPGLGIPGRAGTAAFAEKLRQMIYFLKGDHL